MPHIDRRYLMGLAPTSGPMPPAMLAGTQPPRPKTPLPEPSRPREARKPERLGIPRVDIATHTVDPDRVIEQLFGRPIHVDEHSGVCDLLSRKEPDHGHQSPMVRATPAGISTTG